MPKKLLATTIILVILLALAISTIGVDVVDANPFGLAKQINTPSDAKPPIVSINSPQNDTNYSGMFNISFSVKVPQYYSKSAIVDIYYTINNETVAIPHQYWTLMQGPSICQYSTSITAPTLPAGNHSLKIRAQGGSYDFYNFFLIDGYSQVYFTVSDNSTQTNQLNQTTTQGPALDNNTAMPTIPLVAIISLTVIVVVTSISLVYFKRRRGNQ
jgi:hypothetical protein